MIQFNLPTNLVLIVCLLFLNGCSEKQESPPEDGPQAVFLSVSPLAKIAGPKSHLSRVGVGPNGRVHMSWVEEVGDRGAIFKLAFLEDNKWTTPITVVEGDNLMLNWADFPSVVGGVSNSMAAHWLVENDKGMGYSVRAAVSSDGGANWGESFWLHSEIESSEHGFVSILPEGAGTYRAAWLDSRAHATTGFMELWSVRFNAEGRMEDEVRIDDRTCECCSTSAVLVGETPVLVYRDRKAGEIRDISLSRFDGEKWSKPRIIYPDNWKMPG